MTRDASYTLSLPEKSEKPGTYTVTATGKGYYTGTVTKTYTITKQAILPENISVDTATQTVTVKNKAGATLTEGASYTVKWENVEYDRNGLAYSGQYTITGKGYYTGTRAGVFDGVVID